MTSHIRFNQIAANDSWIRDDSQSIFNFSQISPATQYQFIDLIPIILAKEEQKYRLGEITSQTAKPYAIQTIF